MRKIGFGDSVQDVMSAIGAPSRVFYKVRPQSWFYRAVCKRNIYLVTFHPKNYSQIKSNGKVKIDNFSKDYFRKKIRVYIYFMFPNSPD